MGNICTSQLMCRVCVYMYQACNQKRKHNEGGRKVSAENLKTHSTWTSRWTTGLKMAELFVIHSIAIYSRCLFSFISYTSCTNPKRWFQHLTTIVARLPSPFAVPLCPPLALSLLFHTTWRLLLLPWQTFHWFNIFQQYNFLHSFYALAENK